MVASIRLFPARIARGRDPAIVVPRREGLVGDGDPRRCGFPKTEQAQPEGVQRGVPPVEETNRTLATEASHSVVSMIGAVFKTQSTSDTSCVWTPVRSTSTNCSLSTLASGAIRCKGAV